MSMEIRLLEIDMLTILAAHRMKNLRKENESNWKPSTQKDKIIPFLVKIFFFFKLITSYKFLRGRDFC